LSQWYIQLGNQSGVPNIVKKVGSIPLKYPQKCIPTKKWIVF